MAYSPAQVDEYQAYINFPLHMRRTANPPLDISFLNTLHAHQLSAIPYENLSLHYSVDHKIRLDPHHLFKKVLRNGRGGYCMENSIFFSNILRALGFRAYMVGVKIRPRVDGVPKGDYMGWSHIVNIVTLETGRYMVDISFGGDGAIRPIPLQEGLVVRNIGTQELRLMRDNVPGQVELSHKYWIYQYRNSPEKEWNSFYAFPETEFLHQDFEVMNYCTSTNERSFQTYTVLVVKFLRDDERGVYGKVMMVNELVKLNTGGRTSVVETCKTEDERIRALEKWFGITLTGEERIGIRGRSVELLG